MSLICAHVYKLLPKRPNCAEWLEVALCVLETRFVTQIRSLLIGSKVASVDGEGARAQLQSYILQLKPTLLSSLSLTPTVF